MGAGGIIQKQAKLLLPVVMDALFYNEMEDDEKNDVEAINLKVEVDITAEDLGTLISLINKYRADT